MRFCWHKWSDWSLPVVTYNANKQQWRKCLKCNKAEFWTMRWDKQTSLESILKALKDLS